MRTASEQSGDEVEDTTPAYQVALGAEWAHAVLHEVIFRAESAPEVEYLFGGL